MLFGFGGNFLISFWRDHQISVQKDYLQREARNAMDVIINGSMMEREPGEVVRDAGIIVSNNVEIYDGVIEANQGNKIQLYDINKIFIGRFYGYPYPPEKSISLLLDMDTIPDNGNERRVIPQGVSEAPIQEPYGIEIQFSRDPNDPFLIGIDLTLQQDARGRNLDVRMHSAVYLRNWTP
jgi:hypothetical protein